MTQVIKQRFIRRRDRSSVWIGLLVKNDTWAERSANPFDQWPLEVDAHSKLKERASPPLVLQSRLSYVEEQVHKRQQGARSGEKEAEGVV